MDREYSCSKRRLLFSKIGVFLGFTALLNLLVVVSIASAGPQPIRARTPVLVNYRGWDYLVNKLKDDGISESLLRDIYANPKMPKLNTVYFAVSPKEPQDIYKRFRSPKYVDMGKGFLHSHVREFRAVEKRFGVSGAVVTAIFLVETQLGKVTGNQLVINRLSRLAALSEENNVYRNFRKLQAEQPDVTLNAVKERAEHLHNIFYPEIKAFLEVIKIKGIKPLELRGSVAGAFGMPQFLPSSFLKFGIDADGDKRVSLFSEADAIWSTANFLGSFGWREDKTPEDKKGVIWHYNHSAPYVDTIYWLYDALR